MYSILLANRVQRGNRVQSVASPAVGVLIFAHPRRALRTEPGFPGVKTPGSLRKARPRG